MRQSLRLLDEIQEQRERSWVLLYLGKVALALEQTREAEHFLKEALPLLQRYAVIRGEGLAYGALGELAWRQRKKEEAEQLLRIGLTILRKAYCDPEIVQLLLILGRFLLEERRNRSEGCQMLKEALLLSTTLGFPEQSRAQELLQRFACDR